VLAQVIEPSTGSDAWYVERGQCEVWQAKVWRNSTADEAVATFSPDGRYVAFCSTLTGREEIYVAEFPRGDGQWRVSELGGTQPRWSPTGNEPFYVQSRGDSTSYFEYPPHTRLARTTGFARVSRYCGVVESWWTTGAASQVSPLHYLRAAENLSKRWGPSHSSLG